MSLSSEFLAANPPTEFAEVKGYSQEIAEQDAIRFNDWLTKEGYERPNNLGILQEFLDTNNWPITFYNLRVAFFWTRAEGLLTYTIESDEPEPKVKYNGPPTVMRVQKDSKELEAERAETARLRALDANSPRSQKKIDVGQELRAAYIESRNANRNGGKKSHMSEGQARAEIAAKFPELKPDTIPYNEWVARLRFVQDKDYQE